MVHTSFGPHLATVAVDYPLHGRQTDARALELIAGMKSLKGAEQLVGISHVKTRAVILHIKPGVAISSFTAKSYGRVL